MNNKEVLDAIKTLELNGIDLCFGILNVYRSNGSPTARESLEAEAHKLEAAYPEFGKVMQQIRDEKHAQRIAAMTPIDPTLSVFSQDRVA